jgi:hypothetical protein
MFQTLKSHGPMTRPRLLRGRADLSATIRCTEDGVRIRFSDGRIAWLDRADQNFERFLEEAIEWARLHGAETTRIEHL